MTNEAYILGFASDYPCVAGSNKWYDSRIGGLPVWPEGLDVSISTCPLCDAERVLVLQAYAPHRNHSERLVCLFGCNSIRCAGSPEAWCAVRMCRVRAEKAQETENAGSGIGKAQISTLARGEPDEKEDIQWDTDSGSSDSSEDEDELIEDLGLLSLELQLQMARKAATELEKPAQHSRRRSRSKPLKRGRNGRQDASNDVALDEGVATKSTPSSARPSPAHREPCASCFVEVDFEPEKSKTEEGQSSVETLLEKYMKEENSRAASGALETWTTENEDDDDSAMRRNQELFLETIARAPSQILRYKVGGKPLWPTYPAPVFDGTTKCKCGAPFVFELQVLGSCLHYLKPEECVPPHQAEAGMNFASVAIFTCAEDCELVDTIAEGNEFKVISQRVCVQQDDW